MKMPWNLKVSYGIHIVVVDIAGPGEGVSRSVVVESLQKKEYSLDMENELRNMQVGEYTHDEDGSRDAAVMFLMPHPIRRVVVGPLVQST